MELNITTNIIPYEGNPFSNPIELNVYEIKDKKSLDYPEIGFIIKQFRKYKTNRNTIIFHIGKTIYSSGFIDDSSSKIQIDDFFAHSSKKFYSNNEEDRFILKIYLGELVAFNLRKFRENWRISSRGNTVFQALRNENWDLIGQAISCEAFEYEPIIFEDGSFSLIIEPKHRLFMNYTLRIEDFQNKLTKASHIIDFCPIDCIEKNDPYTLCKLSNPEYLCSKKDIRQVNKKPTEYLINKEGKDYNIKEYSNLDIICPRTDNKQKLGDFIKDIKPVIEVDRFLNDKIKSYGYPLERLRFSFDFRLIEDIDERRKLNSHLRLSPLKKWNRFITISDKLKNLIDPLGNKARDEKFLEFKLRNTTFNQLEETNFLLYKRKSSFPQSRLRNTGPYDRNGKYKRKFEKIKFIVVSFSDLNDNIKKNLKFRLTSTRTNYLSVPNLFYIESELINSIVCDNKTKLTSIFELIKERRKELEKSEALCIIAIYSTKNTNYVDSFKKFCILNDIPCQGLNIDRLSDKLRNQSTMINVFLGLYVKLRGIPWIINTNNEKLIIGFHKVFYEKEVGYCLSYYNSNGIYLNGKAKYIPKTDFIDELKKDLNEINEDLQVCIFLGLGSQNKVKDTILDFLKEKFNEYGYYEIDKSSIINLFEFEKSGPLAARNGIYVKIENDLYYLQTNYFEDCVPATIKIKKIISNNVVEDLQEIYNISQYNPHYAGGISTTLPLPIHVLSRNALPDIRNYKLNMDAINTPWFY